MSEVSSVLGVAPDQVLNFKNVNEIEKFISLYEKEGRRSREEIVNCLAHFVWSFHDVDGVALCFSTWSVNHGNPGGGQNLRFFRKDNAVLGETVVDVKAGDELLIDYRDLDFMDNFWINFCKNEGVKDVVSNLRQYVDL